VGLRAEAETLETLEQEEPLETQVPAVPVEMVVK
jgi:hypothetical protein